jgi:hypothetical protein
MTARAKAVNVWTWRRMLRDHGPDNPSVLLTLHTIATFMDGDGFCFVGQARIAAGARTSVRTVKRHISEARALSWLHVELTRVQGKKNAHVSFLNNYRACVPGYLELDEKDEELRDVVLSSSGDVDEPYYSEGGDTAMAPRSTSRDEGGDTQRTTWGHLAQEVGPNEGEVGTQLWPKNSSVLNSSVLTHQSEGALARPPPEKTTSKKSPKTKTEGPAHISTVVPVHGEPSEEVQQVKTEPPPLPPKPPMRSREEMVAELRKRIGSA